MPWKFKFKGSRMWWVGYRHNGEQILRSTKSADEAEADKQVKKLELMLQTQAAGALTDEFYRTITGRKLPRMTLLEALQSWVQEAEAGTAEGTSDKYAALQTALVKHFHATEKGPMVAEITREQLKDFLKETRGNVSVSTRNYARKLLSIFFRYCRSEDLVKENPVETIKKIKDRRKARRRAFNVVELKSLYKQAPDDFWRYAIVAGFFTGLRLGDLATMPIGAVDLRTGTINILTRKTGTTMRIPIAPPLRAILAPLIASKPGAKPTDPIWPEHAERYEAKGGSWFSQRFYDLMLVKAGLVAVRPHRKSKRATKVRTRIVNEVSFHCLRHSYISTLASLGHNQQIVKALAGHSSDEINDLYTHLPPEVLGPAIAELPDITAEVTK